LLPAIWNSSRHWRIFRSFPGSSQDLLSDVTALSGTLGAMDDMHQPPGGDPQDYWPTQELGPMARPADPPAQPGPQPWGQPAAQPWGQPAGAGGLSASPPRRNGPPRRGALWWGAGLALTALVAGGGVLAASTQPPAAPTGQAAVLNTMLSSANSPAAGAVADDAVTSSATPSAACLRRAATLRAAGHSSAARLTLWRCGHRLRRIRALGGLHGQFTFETKSGPRTIAYERGVILSISGADVVVQAKDGTTWTWVLGSSTVIRQKGKRVAASTLSDGQNVFAGGPVVSGAYDARLIVIRLSSGSSPGPATGS
jgi:hypothetical protein